MISHLGLNVGVSLEKYDTTKKEWVGVNVEDRVYVCDNLLQCLMSDIDIRLNQTRISTSTGKGGNIMSV